MAFVNYQGLRNLITAHTGVELITNGGFDSDSNWTKGAGWSISGGVATTTTGTSSALSQDIGLTEGLTYNVVYTVLNRTAGGVTPALDGSTGPFVSSNGTFQQAIIAGSGTDGFRIVDGSSFDGDIDDVSVILGVNYWDLDFEAVEMTPQKQTPKSPHVARDGTTETIADDLRLSFSVRTLKMDYGSAEWLQWQEFLNSVREGETFTFDPYGTAASPQEAGSAMLEGDWQEIRGARDQFQIAFTVRML